MHVEVVSPEAVLHSGEADMVVARTTQGEIGIMKDHEPVLASLAFGEMRVYDGPEVRDRFAVYGGFIEMRKNVIRVLSDDAELASDIDRAQAAAELEDIRERLEADPENPELDRQYQRALVRSLVAEDQAAGT